MKREGKQPLRRAGLTAGLVVAFTAAAAAAGAGDTAPATLRDTGFFAGGGTETVRADALLFSPQYPLWSDGATKRRWIALPAGTAIDATQAGGWRFPVGTRFWKEFSVRGRRVETRVLEQVSADDWRFAAYVWNAAGTEATRAPAGGLISDVEVAPGVRHVIPAVNDCRSCHEGRGAPVLGFSALQLSPDRDPGAPHAEDRPSDAVDLRTLAARGLLVGVPAQTLAHPPRVAGRTPAERAALGYLAANCGGCHNADGPLAGLEMTLDPLDGPAAVRASTWSRPSRFLPPGAADDAVRVWPGRPELSVLVARMRSRDPLVQMPPLGTKTVDAAGVALIERWISEQTPTQKEKRP